MKRAEEAMMCGVIEWGMESVEETAERLGRGEVGIIPCDTIYGISALVRDDTRERIFEIKERPANKNLIVLMDMESAVSSSDLIIPADILSRWPCALTAIVRRRSGGTLALRVPDDPFLSALLPLTGPIFSTSVNISGRPSLLSFDDILPVFSGKVDFIVRKDTDGKGTGSTLVDATETPCRIVRQGAYIYV